MPSRVNEVKFGLVPGLADLAEKLSNAFAKKRSREMDFEIAKLNKQDADRRAAAAQFEKQRKAEEAAEKQRRSDLQSDVKRAEQLRDDQVRLSTPQGSSHNPSEDELLKFGGLESQDPSENQSAQNQLRISRQLENMSKLAGKTGNESQAQHLLGINQLLAGGGLSIEDLNMRAGDDATLMENLGHNIMGNQPELTSESEAVASSLSQADLSHLPPEEQQAIQAKAQGLTSELPPDTFQPEDIQGQLAYLQQLGEARNIMSQPAGDYFAATTGLDLSNAERDTIDNVMGEVDQFTAIEFPADSGDPALDREDMADRTIASAMVREEVAGIMARDKVGIYDALETYAPGQGFGRQARNEAMAEKYNTPMTSGKQKIYNTFKASASKRSDLSPRQREAFAMMKTVLGGGTPDSAVVALVKTKDLPTLNAVLNRMSKGIKGHRQQDQIPKIDRSKADAIIEIYNDLSLQADQFGGNMDEGTALNMLKASFGFVDAATAAEQAQQTASRFREQEITNRRQEAEAKNRLRRDFVPSAFEDPGLSDDEIIRRAAANNEFR